MNKYPVTGLIFVLFVLLITSCKEKQKSAKAYHDTIYQSVDTIINHFFLLDNYLQEDSATYAEKEFQTLSQIIEKSIKKVESCGSFNGDDKLYNTSMDVLRFYEAYTEKDFQEALTLCKVDTFSENNSKRITTICDSFYDK